MAKKIKVDPSEIAILINSLLVYSNRVSMKLDRKDDAESVKEIMGWYNRDATRLMEILGTDSDIATYGI